MHAGAPGDAVAQVTRPRHGPPSSEGRVLKLLVRRLAPALLLHTTPLPRSSVRPLPLPLPLHPLPFPPPLCTSYPFPLHLTPPFHLLYSVHLFPFIILRSPPLTRAIQSCLPPSPHNRPFCSHFPLQPSHLLINVFYQVSLFFDLPFLFLVFPRCLKEGHAQYTKRQLWTWEDTHTHKCTKDTPTGNNRHRKTHIHKNIQRRIL